MVISLFRGGPIKKSRTVSTVDCTTSHLPKLFQQAQLYNIFWYGRDVFDEGSEVVVRCAFKYVLSWRFCQ
jgi:hypothetical protein